MGTQQYLVTGQKDASSLSIPAGEWSFKNFDRAANPYQIFRTLGHCSAASGTWNVNKIEKRDATRGTRELIASAETQRDLTLSITMDQWDPVQMALAQYGETAVQTIEAKSYARSFTVSPGDELFLLTDDNETPAYNYTHLQLQRLIPAVAKVGRCALESSSAYQRGQGVVLSDGTYSGATDATYRVIITRTGTLGGKEDAQGQPLPAAGYSVERNDGVTVATVSSGTLSTDSPCVVTLTDGVTMTFVVPGAATATDFKRGDVWACECRPPSDILVEGKDFSVDNVDIQTGKVRIKVDAEIGIDEMVTATYDVPHQIFPRMYAGTRKSVEGEFRFQQDPTIGRRQLTTFYHVRLAPTGDMALVTEDGFASHQITATVIADASHASKSNPDSKYFHTDYVTNMWDVSNAGSAGGIAVNLGTASGILVERDSI